MFRENIHYRTPNRFNSLRIRDARSPLDTDWSHTCLPTWGSVLHAIETSAQLRESTRPACSRSPQNHAYPPDQREQRPESGSPPSAPCRPLPGAHVLHHQATQHPTSLQSSPSAPRTQQDCSLSPCLLYTSPSPRDGLLSRMPSS